METSGNNNKITLPSNVLTAHVFRFLGVKSLKKCACVSHEWRNAIDQDVIWIKRCADLWESKKNVPKVKNGVPETLYPFASYPSTISLGIKEMRQILMARGVYSDKFIEKSEYRRALEVSQPPMSRPISHNSKWKLSYVATAVRAMRQNFTRQELINTSWILEFKFNGLRSEAKFLGDGTYWSTLGQVSEHNRNLRWNLVSPPYSADSSPFEFAGVRVGEYPALMASRTVDWGFQLENDYVTFHQEQ
jgi:hypothetical protein